MLTLRPYQHALVERVSEAFARGAGTVCMQLGTGGGKTATASTLLARAVAKGYRAAFVAHLDTLVEDTHARVTAAGIPAGYVQAGRPRTPDAPVQVCSTATLHARGEAPPADFVIVDECHRVMGPSVRALLERYPHASILGLTATPQRGDGQPLGDVFAELICGPSNRWLTERKFLVPCDVFAWGSEPTRELAKDPVDAYRDHARDKRAIVFAETVAHAKDLVARYNDVGFPAELLLGETSRSERQAVRGRVERGETLVLVGVGVFVEGFDLPAIEVVILARSMGVTCAFLQSIGRGLRPSPSTGKTRCTVLDLRGSVFLHGLPDEERVWSLDGTAVRRAEVMPSVRRCGACGALFAPSSTCPRCGAALASSAELPRVMTRAEKLAVVSLLPQHERDARYLAVLMRVAMRMGRQGRAAEAWATGKFQQRFGRAPEVRT